jgi:ABC-type arginine/histidine transport system permease subunit
MLPAVDPMTTMLRAHVSADVQVLLTTLTVGTSLTVALAVPDKAEKIYAVVGATAVCVVCYVIPVYIQLQLYRRQRLWFKQRQVRAN